MNIFEIVGPVMVGPSSSHTAGAVKIGKVARLVFANIPIKADIYLYGSFKKTYRGHGTDKAIVAGVLNFNQDDERIKNSLEIAKKEKIEINIIEEDYELVHPNTAKVILFSKNNLKHSVTAVSIGGGTINVIKVDGMPVSFSCELGTVVIKHRDIPGIISKVTKVLSENNINIANMNVNRLAKGIEALMTIEIDGQINSRAVEKLKKLEDVIEVIFIDRM